MKIIWALDAFEKGDGCQNIVIKALKNLEKRASIEIDAVYVLSPDQLQLPLELSTPWLEHYQPSAEKAVLEIIKSSGLKSIKSSAVLVQKESSLKRSIKVLSAHAKSKGADLIVVGSHSRKGLNRLMLGSFAETLANESPVPVLVVGKTDKAVAQMKWDSILFPSDFSDASKKVFNRVIPFAKAAGAKVSILHSIVNPIEPVFQSGVFLMGGGWVPVPMFFEEQEARQKKIGQEWVALAKKEGIKAELFIDSEASGVIDSILGTAKKTKASLIALAAESGPVASVFIGSVSRSVLRQSTIPVWILRSNK